MKNISALLGLPAELDPSSARVTLGVSSELEIFRTLGDLADLGVLANADKLDSETRQRPLTYIYRMLNDAEVRAVQEVGDESDEGVKFDITVLVSHRQLGPNWSLEYPKTSGHYHTALPGSEYASPDFYQVVSGSGAIVLQHETGGVMYTKVVDVQEGDTLLIAPHLGHTSVNLGEEPLVFANVCVRRPHLNYEDIHRYGGAPYLIRRDPKSGEAVFEENREYAKAGFRAAPYEKVETDWDELRRLGIEPRVPIYDYIADANIAWMLCHPDERHEEMVRALRSTPRP